MIQPLQTGEHEQSTFYPTTKIPATAVLFTTIEKQNQPA